MSIEMESKVIEIDPKTIKRGWRARKDLGDIGELAKSIRNIGQLHPILVKRHKRTGDLIIISGMRRLRACRRLGVKVKAIIANPKDELAALAMQLEENVKRKNFDKLEVSEGLQRLKRVYEKKYPETKLGAKLKKGAEDSELAKESQDRFTKRATDMLGISERSVQ